jgi:hypothetical protein
MKKAFYFIVAIILLVSLAACANPIERAIENAMEQGGSEQGNDSDAEQGNDADEDVDSGDGSVSIDMGDGEDGFSMDTGEGIEWPSDKFPANVPPVPGVKFTGTMSAGGAVWVYFEECDQATADAYIETLKGQGWEVTMNMDAEDGLAVYFDDPSGTLIFGFTKEDGTGSVSYSEKE